MTIATTYRDSSHKSAVLTSANCPFERFARVPGTPQQHGLANNRFLVQHWLHAVLRGLLRRLLLPRIERRDACSRDLRFPWMERTFIPSRPHSPLSRRDVRFLRRSSDADFWHSLFHLWLPK